MSIRSLIIMECTHPCTWRKTQATDYAQNQGIKFYSVRDSDSGG